MATHRERASRSRCSVYDCSACVLYLGRRCPGCARGNVQLMREGQAACAVYACVRELGVAGCYECTEPRCRVGAWQVARCPLRARFGEETTYEQFRQALRVTRGVAVTSHGKPSLSRAASERVRRYLQVLDEYASRGLPTISSHHLARAAGVRSGLVRRDLAGLGSFGTPGRGYELSPLRNAIRRALKLEEPRSAVWLGAKRLRDDKESREALRQVNCRLTAVLDADPREVGRKVAGLPIRSLSQAENTARAESAAVAVIACREAATPGVIQALARGGVKAVLNLTSVSLPASGQVVIEQADVGSQVLRMVSRLGPSAGAETC